MRFLQVFSLLSIAVTSAVASAPVEKRFPMPVAAPVAQPAPVLEFPVVKRQSNSTSSSTDSTSDIANSEIGKQIEAAVPKLKSLIASGGDISGLLGNLDLGSIVGVIKNFLDGSFLSNALKVINGAAVLMGGDAPKIGNQLLTSKMVDVLGQDSTYNTLLPLLKNAKPLASKEFIDNTVGLINDITDIINSIGNILGALI
ncbi:hypothetical protein KEM52_006095 [Ascosphaera acerosa]|nr:hypothetical protein KEM52_006095 [Ascosphaera acerosa]